MGTLFTGLAAYNTDRKGPSLPIYVVYRLLHSIVGAINRGLTSKIKLTMEFDFVDGFPCDCPSVLHRWKDRVRLNKWPSKEDIDIVAELPACVVSVGEKECEHQNLKWRLCFPLAEIHLIKSMNITQTTKVHVLMKLIAKHYLKPVCEDITSYVVKHVMLWLAVETPLENYQPRYLLDRLTDALKCLRECIQKKWLNYYMIPERNLFKGKLTDSIEKALVIELNNVIERLHTYSRMILADPNHLPEPIENMRLHHVYADIIDKFMCL